MEFDFFAMVDLLPFLPSIPILDIDETNYVLSTQSNIDDPLVHTPLIEVTIDHSAPPPKVISPRPVPDGTAPKSSSAASSGVRRGPAITRAPRQQEHSRADQWGGLPPRPTPSARAHRNGCWFVFVVMLFTGKF